MASSSELRKVTLRSSDGEEFMVDEAAATLSKTINNMVEDGCSDGVIPVTNVNAAVLSRVLQYCNKHQHKVDHDDKEKVEELKNWEQTYIDVALYLLYDLLLASNYLDIQGLLDLAAQAVADKIRGKTPDQVREILGIKNDFSVEEEDEIKKEIDFGNE